MALLLLLCACEGSVKVVYVSANYSYALTYKCSDRSYSDGACGNTAVEVISRSRDMSEDALDDVMQHVGDLCVRPFEFRSVSHEGSFSCDGGYSETHPGPSVRSGGSRIFEGVTLRTRRELRGSVLIHDCPFGMQARA